MQDDIDLDVLAHFMRVPHKGLARIIATLDVLGIATDERKWASRGDVNFPRIEYLLDDSGYRLNMGVSRQPFKGHISWISIHGLNEDNESSSILRLCYLEESPRWYREHARGTYTDERMGALIREWFPTASAEAPLEDEYLVNATLQHFVNLLLEG